ncbi:MAG: hypothetical protein ACRDRD_10290 [Pseudonocardiaceae bacterium]
MLRHDPEQEPPDDAVEDRVDERGRLAELLELTDEFLQQASPQVRAELALFLTTQRGWHPETGLHAYLDWLSFTALGLRDQAKGGTC